MTSMPRQQQFGYTSYLSQGRPDSQRPAWEAAGSPKSQQTQKPFDYSEYLRQGRPDSQRPAWEAAGSPKSRPQQTPTPFSAYAPQQQSAQYGQQQPYQQQWSPGQAQPMGPQSQGTPYNPSAPQQQFSSYGQQPFFTPGGGMGNMAYAAPDQRPAPFQQSTTMFGQQVDPMQAFAQRGAFVQNLMDSRAQQAQQWGMGNYQPPSRDFGTMWSQAGDMVQQGWQNPFSQAQPVQPPSQGTPYGQQAMRGDIAAFQSREAAQAALGNVPLQQTRNGWVASGADEPLLRSAQASAPAQQATVAQQPAGPPKPAFDVNVARKLRDMAGIQGMVTPHADLELLAMSYDDYAQKYDSGEAFGTPTTDMRRKMGHSKATREQFEAGQKAATPDLASVYQRLSQSPHTSGVRRGEIRGAEDAFKEMQKFLKENPGTVPEDQIQKLNSAYQADVKAKRLQELDAERQRLRGRASGYAQHSRELNLWRNEYAALEDKIARAKQSPDGNPGTVWPMIR